METKEQKAAITGMPQSGDIILQWQMLHISLVDTLASVDKHGIRIDSDKRAWKYVSQICGTYTAYDVFARVGCYAKTCGEPGNAAAGNGMRDFAH